ncbi:hypothetical protein PC129_g4428 [Phytophthora cactorum]|uniref:Uncharacterized protein n=1 Tax=Phytophthora cactorum TaxID=29920 RepID=A0A329RR79_9STRA|nr:hypothetical protein Pcac1_g1909 [Phytophthora cactorum]KAG2830716.1 hypothetical protein PC111_g7253 [Phytophthora cactorum]KAG2833531.1 hypothetical protein PC112_g6421 [Phytophthora cactorum]KAG2862215.1 hypothetical protein PC113_g6482 [Phytophthora cactorum]KAG2912132.1 hypothetical protein PC114_g9024 [Phytophthora cactorum]
MATPAEASTILARLQAVPLSTPVLAVGDAGNRARGEVIQSDPDAQMTLERQPEISPSATLVSAKRKNQMDSLQDKVGDPMLGSPTKRTRKGCSRELSPGKESNNS